MDYVLHVGKVEDLSIVVKVLHVKSWSIQNRGEWDQIKRERESDTRFHRGVDTDRHVLFRAVR